jgi:formylglycine-generating enzyme required for sulfatase activity
MTEKEHIDEQNFDELLNKLFLEEQAETPNGQVAQFVFHQNYDVKIDAGKEKELLDKLKGKPKGPGNYWNLLIIAFVAIVIGASGILLYKEYNPVNTDPAQKNTYENKTSKPENSINIPKSRSAIASAQSATNDRISSTAQNSVANAKINATLPPKFSSMDVSVYFPQSGVGSRSAAVFFQPAEQDLVFYSKVKTKMLEKLLRLDKETYASIEEGEIYYRGNALALYPFALRNQAITNLEYKVFLADLLKNGKTDEFKKAVIRSETWVNYNDNILATTYFFDEKYNDFPVVNVSPLAAFLFCDWLEKEINQFSQQLDPQAGSLKVRLPFDSEWIFATRRGYAHIPDCGGYNTIYDIQEGIVDMSYLKRIELIKKRGKSKRTMLDDLFSTNRYGMNEDETLRLFEQAMNYKGKPVTDSLYPNRMDVYSKAAHVSEITLDQETGNVLIVGSCWKNKQEYATMLKEFKKTAASPFVGFRVVIVTDNKASYKDPFW